MLLDHVRVPRTHLLNKQGDVTPEGKYVSPYKDKSKRFGAVLGTLSGGRVGITGLATCNLIMAVTISLRFVGNFHSIFHDLLGRNAKRRDAKPI